MMKVCCYTRVSTTAQENEGYSLSAQEESARAYCKAQGWELTAVYADAKSGSSMAGRGELARLLVDAADGEFERVIVWKLDRLGRNLRDLLDISDQLEQAGVGVVSIQESLDTGTAAGRMMRSILGSLAEFERETIVERIVAGIRQKAREGELVGPLPLGYLRNEDGEVVVDEATAPLVLAAFERYKEGGVSLREMATWAATVGLRSTEGNPLDRLSIRKILNNQTYTGHVAYHERRGGGVVAKGKHPAIIGGDTFDKVQAMLHSRRKHAVTPKPFGRDPYPLSGIGVCGADGAPLLGLRASSGRERYMRCSTAQRMGKHACEQRMVRADVLEAQVASYVGGMRLPPEYLGAVVAELRARQQQPRPDPDESARIERQLERWRRLFVMEEIDEPRYHRETSDLRRRQDAIEPPQEVLDVEKAVLLLRDAGALWARGTRSEQRDFVQEVFERIVVTGPQVSAITPKPSYAPLFAIDRNERFAGDMGLVWLPGQDSNLQPSG